MTEVGPGSSPAQPTRRVVVGRVVRPHGVRGELTVEIRTDDPERRFAAGALLHTDPPEPGPVTVEGVRRHGALLLVSFRGVSDRVAAAALRGVVLLAEVDPVERPGDPDEYYDHQLEGLTAVTTAGARLGTVEQVLHLPGHDLLSVRRADGREVLVPFVAQIVPEVDLSAGRLLVTPPPGLLDLDGR